MSVHYQTHLHIGFHAPFITWPITCFIFAFLSYVQGIQVAAARVLSMLFITAYYIEPNSSGNVCLGLDDKQIADIRHSVKSTLVKQLDQNGDLFVAKVNLLTAATHYQVCFNRAYFLYLST